jgi:hypothetical protein
VKWAAGFFLLYLLVIVPSSSGSAPVGLVLGGGAKLTAGNGAQTPAARWVRIGFFLWMSVRVGGLSLHASIPFQWA